MIAERSTSPHGGRADSVESSVPARPAATPERRRFKRLPYQTTVRVTELDDFGQPLPGWDCRVVDLSRAGIGMRSRRMTHENRIVIIELPSANGRTKVLFGAVRHSRYAEGEGYVIGVEFRAIPKTPVIRQWLEGRNLVA